MPGGKWRLPAVVVAAALAMVTAVAHAEDDSDTPAFPTTVFADGATSASVSVGDVTATVRLLRGATPDPDKDKVWLQVKVGILPVAETYAPDAGFDVPEAEASIAEIDPGNRHREVYFAAYTGGAHCCTDVVVAEEQPHGWVTVKVGEFDGGGDYLQDIDHDGLAEIVTVDNRFLYTFDCYACSAAPLVVYSVRNGAVVDVSTDPRYLPAHRDWLAQLERLHRPRRTLDLARLPRRMGGGEGACRRRRGCVEAIEGALGLHPRPGRGDLPERRRHRRLPAGPGQGAEVSRPAEAVPRP